MQCVKCAFRLVCAGYLYRKVRQLLHDVLPQEIRWDDVFSSLYQISPFVAIIFYICHRFFQFLLYIFRMPRIL